MFRPTVTCSNTQNFGAIMSSLANVQLQGQTDLITAINVAQLALKHRQNKSQRQRVIAFVGSPLSSTSAVDLVKLGKKMKKNNVAVDIVNFGEDAENEEKLREFVDAVNSSDNSHLVNVPAGTVLLSDMIMSSPMLAEDGVVPQGGAGGSGAGGSRAGAGGEDGDFGAVDPSLDPELAMVWLVRAVYHHLAKHNICRPCECHWRRSVQGNSGPRKPRHQNSQTCLPYRKVH